MGAKNVFFSYWKSILVTVGILYLSFAPPSTFESAPRISQFPHSDKVVHFVMFFVLTAVLIYECTKSTNARKREANSNIQNLNNKNSCFRTFVRSRKFLLVCILFPIVLGGIIEIMQEAFFKPRSAEWLDWAADIAGVLAAWAVFLIARKKLSELGFFGCQN